MGSKFNDNLHSKAARPLEIPEMGRLINHEDPLAKIFMRGIERAPMQHQRIFDKETAKEIKRHVDYILNLDFSKVITDSIIKECSLSKDARIHAIRKAFGKLIITERYEDAAILQFVVDCSLKLETEEILRSIIDDLSKTSIGMVKSEYIIDKFSKAKEKVKPSR